MTTNEKIKILREEMDKKGLWGYIIPSGDPHMSEYLSEFYQFRHWISGFTGSAGTFALTHDKSGLWTDGRYYIQAEGELSGSEIELYRAMQPGVISYVDFFCQELKEGDKVGIDSRLFAKNAVTGMQKKFSEKGIELVFVKAPSLFPHWYDEWDEQVDAYAEKYGITYYNFLELAEEVGIDYTTDTYDAGMHMNLSGAEKLSDYLGQKLVEEHGVTVRNTDESYKEVWEPKVEAYNQAIQEAKEAEAAKQEMK